MTDFHTQIRIAGKSKRLSSIDISTIATTIGCGEDHLHADMEVETRGGYQNKTNRAVT